MNLELGTWNLKPWNLELGTWNLEPGTWNLDLGPWNFRFPDESDRRLGSHNTKLHTSPNRRGGPQTTSEIKGRISSPPTLERCSTTSLTACAKPVQQFDSSKHTHSEHGRLPATSRTSLSPATSGRQPLPPAPPTWLGFWDTPTGIGSFLAAPSHHQCPSAPLQVRPFSQWWWPKGSSWRPHRQVRRSNNTRK